MPSQAALSRALSQAQVQVAASGLRSMREMEGHNGPETTLGGWGSHEGDGSGLDVQLHVVQVVGLAQLDLALIYGWPQLLLPSACTGAGSAANSHELLEDEKANGTAIAAICEVSKRPGLICHRVLASCSVPSK